MKNTFISATALLSHMEWHMKRTVKHYRSDFYKYDIERVMDMEKNHEYGNYLWIIRECGTHIVTLVDGQDLKDNDYYMALDALHGDEMKTFTLAYNRNGFTFHKGL